MSAPHLKLARDDAPPVSRSAWSPLGIALFRSLWIATVISNIGTWAQEAGGPWLMKILSGNDAQWVALVAAAANAPRCILSLPAGVLADVFDRRKLLILTQLWMLLASGALGILTLTGHASPGMLLAFTLLLGIGDALAGPAFQAIVPELVPPADMPLAVALNSVALNVARAAGPALGMLVVVWAGGGHGAGHAGLGESRGPGASFVLNALSFVGVAWVLFRWRRPPQAPRTQSLPAATHEAWVYLRDSSACRAILVRVAIFIVCAVALWAQLPVIAAKQLGLHETGYALLMASLGVGAVAGVVAMPWLQRALSVEKMVTLCTGAFTGALAALSITTTPWVADLLMVFIGFNWVIIPTNFNIATQKAAPPAVKGRALALYLTTLFGAWALGSILWGKVAKASDISHALLYAAAGLALGMLLYRRFPLTPPASFPSPPRMSAT